MKVVFTSGGYGIPLHDGDSTTSKLMTAVGPELVLYASDTIVDRNALEATCRAGDTPWTVGDSNTERRESDQAALASSRATEMER